ncbi:MAG: sugar phosphate isomerase/epimerase [Eubacteriales bacterium]|nr:sugar phosphate isomerase/epimerase [Eubacteriales bacterium]
MRVGLQVYTVRKHLKEDPRKTLEQVVNSGYKYIEFANHNAEKDTGIGFGYSLEEMQKIVKDLGITVVGAHVMTTQQQAEHDIYSDLDYFKKIVDFYVGLGAKFISNPQEFFPDLDTLKRRCEVYNKLGELCKENGLRYLYHNHWNEYQLMEGETIFDHLMANTDPEYIGIELDAYWAFRGLINPVEMIHQYGNRIGVLHEKDFPLDMVDELNSWKVVDRTKLVDHAAFASTIKPSHFTEVGNGIIKIQDVIDAGNEYNIPYILVEQDHSRLDEIDSINVSMTNFKKMRGLEWD